MGILHIFQEGPLWVCLYRGWERSPSGLGLALVREGAILVVPNSGDHHHLSPVPHRPHMVGGGTGEGLLQQAGCLRLMLATQASFALPLPGDLGGCCLLFLLFLVDHYADPF